MARRRTTSIALLIAVGLSPLTPIEHLHALESVGRHGHDVVAHRHVNLHAEQVSRDRAPSTSLESADTLVTYLDLRSSLAGRTFVVAACDVATNCLANIVPLAGDRVRFERIERRIHAPPRGPTTGRAPPSPSSL